MISCLTSLNYNTLIKNQRSALSRPIPPLAPNVQKKNSGISLDNILCLISSRCVRRLHGRITQRISFLSTHRHSPQAYMTDHRRWYLLMTEPFTARRRHLPVVPNIFPQLGYSVRYCVYTTSWACFF